jgi:hypothetical protein
MSNKNLRKRDVGQIIKIPEESAATTTTAATMPAVTTPAPTTTPTVTPTLELILNELRSLQRQQLHGAEIYIRVNGMRCLEKKV